MPQRVTLLARTGGSRNHRSPRARTPLSALLFLLVEIFELVEQTAHPVTWKELSLSRPVIKPLRQEVTEQARGALAGLGRPRVSILRGRDARDLRPLLGDLPSIESDHPSPLSADRGFFGSRPFSRANDLLARQGAQPVDWRLP